MIFTIIFTDEQKAVIQENSRNLLLLARAGSGKTFTVSNKIANAIENGLSPEEILCLTFTVKGAGELKDDVKKYCGVDGVNVFTIHGFCYNLIKNHLKETAYMREPLIADEVDVGEALAKLLRDFAENGEYSLSDDAPLLPERQLSKIISQIKHKRDELGFNYLSEDGYGATINTLFLESSSFNSLFSIKKRGVKVTDYSLIDLLKKKGGQFCLAYKRYLLSSNLLDFDDLIFFAKHLLLSKEYKKPAYKLIIIDEMQDTSMVEYEIAKQFFKGAQVLMCGDPYQTIYSWRGSTPFDIMRDFTSVYGAKTVRLNGNHRSSKLITYAGQYYLSKTFQDGVLEQIPTIEKDEEKIEIVKCYDFIDEADYLFDYIKNYKGDLSSLCVMARSNRYLADLYKRFESRNLTLPKNERLAFFTADSDFQFYKKPVVKDFLSFLKLLVNPNDDTAFSRIAEKYINGVGKETISAIKDFGAYGLSLSSFLKRETYQNYDPFYSLISAYKSKNVVIYDLETTGLDLEKDEMIQLSAKKLTGENFNRFVLPKREISEKALATHGYDLKHILANGGQDAKKVLSDFANFAKGCVLVGHNSSSFDDFILKRQLQENGINFTPTDFFDTLSLAQTILPNLVNYKLSSCCEHFGVVNQRAHDAFSDVEATFEIFIRFLEDFILPQKDARRRLVSSRALKFQKFYEDYLLMQEYLRNGQTLSLVKFIDQTFGVLKRNAKESDKDSANDLYKALKQLENSKDTTLWLKSFLSDAALSGSQLDVIIKKHGKIPLITVHQSKGCEFETVILAGASENELPSYGARQSGDETEEKRIFYVALSRAKKKFIATYPSKSVQGQNVYQRNPSPYLSRLPSDAVENKSTY
ncbi:MAG: UvrD-helicase domain-containing protein [Clostridia bacterium]|nr:UvrD-helicase domain-containing protein [Clostridia bacterium]